MVIQPDFYRAEAGYQQQQQEEDRYCATQNHTWIVKTKPNPCIAIPQYASHQMMYDGGYAQQQDGWYGHGGSKQENGGRFIGATAAGQELPYNFNDYPYDQYSNSASQFKIHPPGSIMECRSTYREMYHVPKAASRVQAVRYECGSVFPPSPVYDEQIPSDGHGYNYRKAEWTPKGL